MKNIIFCADGTWNHPKQMDDGLPADTNVRKLYDAFVQDATQVVLYDSGVGSGKPLLEHIFQGITGDGLLSKVMEGYRLIASQYGDGDRIHIFGFSRGAYTARSLAGLIADCGLPGDSTAKDLNRLDAAASAVMQCYRECDLAKRKQSLEAFKEQFGQRMVKIATVGVWDTVGALGIPDQFFDHIDDRIYGFLDTSLHPSFEAAFHAVSIDEKRREFQPTLWTSPPAPGQILEQVWFCGVHGDVGGGYPECELSDITLHWMSTKAVFRGLLLNQDKIPAIRWNDALGVIHNSWSIVPWGLPEARKIPSGSVLASSVGMRQQYEPNYTPRNLDERMSLMQFVKVI